MAGSRDLPVGPAARWGVAAGLVTILGTEIAVMLIGTLNGPAPGARAALQLVVYVVGVGGGVVQWWHAPRRPPAHGCLAAVLAVGGVLWVVEAGRRVASGDGFNPLWATVPLVLALLWRRPPNRGEAAAVVTGVSWALAGAAVISVALEVLGLADSWYSLWGFEYLRDSDASTYWLPLAGPLGLEGRWAGPFLHPNTAGPVGALLLVVGLCRQGRTRWLFLAVGFAILVLTSSRTSVAAALLATLAVLVTALVWDPALRRDRVEVVVHAGVPAAVAVLFARALLGGSGTLPPGVDTASGRSSIWPVYVDLWLESPWWGVPDQRIARAAIDGDLPSWAATAHNLLLDSLTRFGLVGATLVVVALCIAGVLAIRAAASHVRVGIGLIAVILGGALTEALVSWRMWAVSTIILFLAVIASAGPYPPARWPGRRSSAPERTTSAAD